MPLAQKRIFQTAIGFALAGVFLYTAFQSVNFSDLWQTVLRIQPGWVAAAIPITLASHWVRALRWRYLLVPVKRPTSTRNLFSAVMIGFMVNNVTPRAGELVRAYVAGKLEGVSKSSTLGSVVAERIVDLISFFFIVCLVFFVYPDAFDPFVESPDTYRPLFLVGSVVGIGFFVFLFLRIDLLESAMGWGVRFLPAAYRTKAERLVGSFISGFGVARMPEMFAPVIGLSFLMWLLYVLGMYVIFFAFDDLVALQLGFGAAVVLLTISAIAFVLPAPGALGTFHSFVTFAMVNLYGVETATALGYSIVVHELGYILVGVTGLYYLLRDNLRLAELNVEAGTP
jgi:uncharacterized protein (TIRG00374 family)